MLNTVLKKSRLTKTVSLFLCLLAFCSAPTLFAEKVYRYQDENGKWHFTNRKSQANENAEVKHYQSKARLGRAEILIRKNGSQKDLIASNPYGGPVQAIVKFNNGEYRHAVVPAGGETVLQANLSAEQEEFQSGIVWGDWQAEVEEQIVALPIAKNTKAGFSQVFNGSFSHQQPLSRYAVDIPMDVGTVIHAAKAGSVMLVKDDYHMGGVNQFFLDKANQIAVLHDDGSIALYGHILLGTAMVEVGQPVAEGEALAKSGSSGYSTGPHLHFVIIKNDNGRNVSIPFKFLVNGKALVPEKGQRLLNE